MCVCVCLCMCVRARARARVCVCVCVGVCVCVAARIYVCTSTYTNGVAVAMRVTQILVVMRSDMSQNHRIVQVMNTSLSSSAFHLIITKARDIFDNNANWLHIREWRRTKNP